jgi:two-component system sensor histidine kinase RegB
MVFSFPKKRIKETTQIQAIIALRSVAIGIQLLLISFVNLVLLYELPWLPIISIIVLEIIFTFASYQYFIKQAHPAKAGQWSLFLQICADILFLTLLLFFSGGATNAFVSLLLIPIAIAAVTLTPARLMTVALLAILSYSIMLWLLPMSVMHGNMEGHFIGMGINFLFSTLVVAGVVGSMARRINQRELAIASYRENLLKQEQVTSLGVAAAQVTHQLATPIATVQLLADELQEDFPDNDVIVDMQAQLKRCRDSLSDYREMVFATKEQTISEVEITTLMHDIKSSIRVNHPQLTLVINDIHDPITVMADMALLPAILNLINNAVRASKANQCDEIMLTSQIKDNNWQLIIRDFGVGFTLEKLVELGSSPVESKQGLGMAVFLSHVSLERLGGHLALTNHQEGGALVVLSLPLKNKLNKR